MLFAEKVSCPGMFHCPGSYCLPYRKLCDNIKDCPGGEDEHDCDAYLCPGEPHSDLLHHHLSSLNLSCFIILMYDKEI